jgi:small subunit ribosomal protein S8
MKSDIFSEMLTRIRNATRTKRPGVEITKTRITQSLAKILLQEGLIEEITDSVVPLNRVVATYEQLNSCLFLRLKYLGVERVSAITNLQRVSRPGLRVYTNYKGIPKIFGGLGLLILSTPKGLITDCKARKNKLGGEILCSIWLYILSRL